MLIDFVSPYLKIYRVSNQSRSTKRFQIIWLKDSESLGRQEYIGKYVVTYGTEKYRTLFYANRSVKRPFLFPNSNERYSQW